MKLNCRLRTQRGLELIRGLKISVAGRKVAKHLNEKFVMSGIEKRAFAKSVPAPTVKRSFWMGIWGLSIVALIDPTMARADEIASSACASQPVMEGCGTFTWPDGTRYVGNFHGGFMKGEAKIFFGDGAVLDGTVSSTNGVASYVDESGRHLSGQFEDASPDLAHPHAPIDYPFWRGFFGDSANAYVAIVIDEQGKVTSAKLLQDIDSPSYAKAAIDGVSRWLYLPAKLDGVAIKSIGIVNVQFSKAR